MALGLVGGVAAGLAYWKFIGCSSGNCAITSSWWRSGAYFGVLGVLLTGALYGGKKKKEDQAS